VNLSTEAFFISSLYIIGEHAYEQNSGERSAIELLAVSKHRRKDDERQGIYHLPTGNSSYCKSKGIIFSVH